MGASRRDEVRAGGTRWDYVDVAVDDHSRPAYVEVLADEKVDTRAGFLRPPVAWFAAREVTVH